MNMRNNSSIVSEMLLIKKEDRLWPRNNHTIGSWEALRRKKEDWKQRPEMSKVEADNTRDSCKGLKERWMKKEGLHSWMKSKLSEISITWIMRDKSWLECLKERSKTKTRQRTTSGIWNLKLEIRRRSFKTSLRNWQGSQISMKKNWCS